MRRVLTLAVLVAAVAATAGEPAGPPAPVTDGDVTAGAVGEVQVIVQRVPGAELVTAALAIRGGVQLLDARTAGVELLGLRTAASGGTRQLDKDAFSRRLAKLGSTVRAHAAAAYSVLQAKSLLSAWEPTFDLLTEVFLQPALPDAELELQRQQQLQGLKHELETPDGALGVLSHGIVFAGTPYANRTVGTEESVSALTAEDVRSHLAQLRVQRRLLLVVVGDVPAEAVFARARRALGSLPTGDPLPPPPPALSFSKPRLEVESRRLPTNFILALFAGPSWQSPDFAAARLGTAVLADREFLEVRTKRNLSYAAFANLDVSRPQSFGALYVSAVDPAAALPVMEGVAKDLASRAVPDKELAGYRSTFLTRHLEGQQTTDGAAGRLVEAQLLGGDWHLVRTLPERIRKTTAQDVQAFAQKYVRDYQVAVVGDPQKVDLSMLR